MLVEMELTTCGCSHGGIGSVRMYRNGVELKKAIVYRVWDIVEFIMCCPGDKYLVRLRQRLEDDAFAFLIRKLEDMGAVVRITVNQWDIDAEDVLYRT